MKPSEGAPVVCLHSSASSGRQWEKLATHLDGHFRVEAPDLAGYGRNAPWPSGAEWSLRSEASRIVSLLAPIDGPFHLVGHSYGAAVAVRITLDHPEKVSSLTLYEPTLFSLLTSRDSWPCGAEPVIALADQIRPLLGSEKLGDAMRLFVTYWAGAEAWLRLDPEQRWRLARRAHKPLSDFTALFGAGITLNDLRKISAPVLCLCGAATTLPARLVAEHLAEAVPGTRYIRFPDLAHMGPLTHPGLINAHIRRFLEEIEERTVAREPRHAVLSAPLPA